MKAPLRSALVAVVLSPFCLSIHTSGQVGYDDDDGGPALEPDSLRSHPRTPSRHETRFEVAGGPGTYASVTRGCSGVIDADQISTTEFGGAVEHEFPNGLVIGARGGRIEERVPGRELDDGTVAGSLELVTDYINPYIAFGDTLSGVGVGYLAPIKQTSEQGHGLGLPARGFAGSRLGDVPISAHLRAGNAERTHFVVSFNETLPLFVGGALRTGFGFNSKEAGAQIGVNWRNPNDRPNLYFDLDLRPAPSLTLGIKSRLGSAESVTEAAIGFRIQYRWVH